MPATTTTLTGGHFQDANGNVLALGYLTFKLNQDNSVSGVASISSGVEVTVKLDSNGSILASPAQKIWATDVMTTLNAFYKVTGYTASGQPAWGPNNQQVVSGGTGGGTFDVGLWVPGVVFSWTPPIQPLTLKTNGTLNGSQSLLNLKQGANAAITDDGVGGVTIAVTGITGITLKTNGVANGSQTLLNLKNGTGIAVADDGVGGVTVTNTLPAGTVFAGENVIELPPLNTAFPGTVQFTVNSSGATNSFVQYIPGTDLLCQPLQWTISLRTVSSSTTVQAVMRKCALGSSVVLSTTPVTFGGNATPTLAPAGTYTSDVIAMPLDTAHDYFLVVNSSTNLFGAQESGSGQSGRAAGVYVEAADFTSTSPLTFTGGTNEAGKALTMQFLSA